MIAKDLLINNFMGIEQGRLKFKNDGLVLIEGINNASHTSNSNGASKSSIYDAIQWCLYGTTKRGIKGDSVVNNHHKKDCIVDFYFDDFWISRARKHTEYSNELRIFKFVNEKWEDITKGTTKDSQQLIVDILGMSELTFSKIAHFGQGDLKSFATLTDKEFKKAFEEALGLSFFSEDEQKVRTVRKEIEGSLGDLCVRQNALRIQYDNSLEMYEVHDKSSRRFENQKKTHLEQLATSEKEDFESAVRIKKEIEKLKAITLDKEAINKISSEINKNDSLLKRLNDVIARKERELALAEAELSQNEKETDKTKLSVSMAHGKIGTECGECGKEYRKEDISGFVAQAENTLKKLSEIRSEAFSKVSLARTRLEEAKALRPDLEAKLTSLYNDKAAAMSDGGGQQNIDSLQCQLDSYISRIKSTKSKILTVKDQENEDIFLMEKCSEKIEETKAKLDDVQKQIDELEVKLSSLKMLETALGDHGLKSYVFDNVTPELNALIQKNMVLLDDIDIEVSTIKQLASGEFREKFSVKVVNKYGASVYAGNSGGEKQKINIGLSLAFNALVRSLSPNSLSFMFLDEVFESLDDGSSEPVMELCRELTKEIPNVFLITHQPNLKELVDKTLTVEKTGKLGKFYY